MKITPIHGFVGLVSLGVLATVVAGFLLRRFAVVGARAPSGYAAHQ